MVLDEALACGGLRLTESSEIGSVPRLLAKNSMPRSVLLLDGEELIGVKQNRVVNLSILLGPNITTEIPVSCVEAGRWRTTSTLCSTAGRVQFADARAQKLEQVSASLRTTGRADSDQRSVWDAISAKAARMGVSSPTAAMAAVFESQRDDLRAFTEALRPQDGQIGAAYAIGGELVGVEVLDSSATFRKVADKLTTSYALDAVEATSGAPPPEMAAVRAFLEQLGAATRKSSSTVGLGMSMRLSSPEVVGAALVWEESCIHLAAFRRQPADVSGPGHNGRGARMQQWRSRAHRS
jgi:hypothetical protein